MNIEYSYKFGEVVILDRINNADHVVAGAMVTLLGQAVHEGLLFGGVSEDYMIPAFEGDEALYEASEGFVNIGDVTKEMLTSWIVPNIPLEIDTKMKSSVESAIQAQIDEYEHSKLYSVVDPPWIVTAD